MIQNLSKEQGGNLTPFKKGHISWNKNVKGYSTKKKGQYQKPWNDGLTKDNCESLKLMGIKRKGFKFSKESKEKMRKAKLGIKRPDLSKLFKGRISPRKGKTHTKESKELIRKARVKQKLPLRDSSIEIKIKSFLDKLKSKYQQHKVIKIKHYFPCDFFLPKFNLVIECDGDYWHKYPVGKDIDHIRTKEMVEKGFKVLRLWENQINKMDFKDFNRFFSPICSEEQASINHASNSIYQEPKAESDIGVRNFKRRSQFP